MKSYGSQVTIRELGEIVESYEEVKKLHYFVNESRKDPTPTMLVIPRWEEDGLQVSVRSNNETGYMFRINHSRYHPKKTQKSVKFEVKLKDKVLRFPRRNAEIQDSMVSIRPLDVKLDAMRLNYATAQLMENVDNCYPFFQNRQIPVELSSDKSAVRGAKTSQAKIQEESGSWIANGLNPEKGCVLRVQLQDGEEKYVVILTEGEADNCWLLERDGKKVCYISDADLYSSFGGVYILSIDKKAAYYKLKTSMNPRFEQKAVIFNQSQMDTCIQPKGILEEIKRLETADFHGIEPYQQRYRRFFFREFGLGNPSMTKKVTLFMYPESKCILNLNDTQVNQEIKPNQLNKINLTEYARKGVNLLFASFPSVEGRKLFAVRIVVEYYNHDRIEFSTGSSQLSTDCYSNPSLTRESL